MSSQPRAEREQRHSTGALAPGAVSALDQVRLFEARHDPQTRAVLADLPLSPSARCLEVGAGAGSVAHWLCEQVPHGGVVALDIDVRYLDPTAHRNLEIRHEDVTTALFAPGSFDLVHARGVLAHLPDPESVLHRMVSWLVPGGWLVVEDFYHLPPEDAPTPVGRALLGGYRRQMADSGADLRWARRLPRALTGAGLESVKARVSPAGPGQSSLDDELIGLRLRQEGSILVERGLVMREELDAFVLELGTEGAWDITVLATSAWGRRRAEHQEVSS
ncbi:class I SAM-dependent methyltransferase [Salinispora fenicalii]|uniref:class I SAM-dependent methyltransferase n=1 Tax=Salinispora fenicalii TaxID=1137263 RepID=UPI0004BCA22C|nr:methyltransferase domain-containing protein [Salinispora fenicalii]